MPDLQDAAVAVKEGADEGVSKAETPVAQESNGETTSAQATDEGASGDEKIGPDTLPPELEQTRKQLIRDYHGKTQKLAEDKLRFEQEVERLRSESGSLQKLLGQDWFKKAMEAERGRRSGVVQDVDIADEDIAAISAGDKKAFLRAVNSVVERALAAKVSPHLSQTTESIAQLKTERSFERIANKYKDFGEAHKQGLLKPYLDDGSDYEAAYKQFKFDKEFSDFDSKVEAKANELLQRSKEGSILKGGTARVEGQEIVKAKNFDDAFDKVFAAMKRGVKDVKVVRE